MGIDVYDSTGMRQALNGGRFRSNMVDSLPQYFTRTLHGLEVAARGMESLPDIQLAARRVFDQRDTGQEETKPSKGSRIKGR